MIAADLECTAAGHQRRLGTLGAPVACSQCRKVRPEQHLQLQFRRHGMCAGKHPGIRLAGLSPALAFTSSAEATICITNNHVPVICGLLYLTHAQRDIHNGQQHRFCDKWRAQVRPHLSRAYPDVIREASVQAAVKDSAIWSHGHIVRCHLHRSK